MLSFSNYSGGSSDPFVKVRIEGYDTKKTKVIKKNLNPTWNEKMTYPSFSDSSLSAEVSVEDYNDLMTSTFMVCELLLFGLFCSCGVWLFILFSFVLFSV